MQNLTGKMGLMNGKICTKMSQKGQSYLSCKDLGLQSLFAKGESRNDLAQVKKLVEILLLHCILIA